MDKPTTLMPDTLRENENSALLILSPENRRYLTGMKTSFGAVLAAGNNEIWFFTDFRYALSAKSLSEKKGFHFIEADSISLYDKINALIESLGIKRLFIEDNFISYALFKKLSRELKAELFSYEGIIDEIRYIKTPEEIALIKESQLIAEKSLKNTLDILKPGITEKEGAAYLTYELLKNGSENGEFGIIFASGENSAIPHAVPGERRIQKGDFILIDFGAIYEGYYSDITRTVAIGEPADKMRMIYEIVLKANKSAVKEIKPGAACKDIDKKAREIITQAGYGKYFGHNLGHGLGLKIHEEPKLSPASSRILDKGNAVTVEPGIYLPGEFGVRIEDLICVTEKGYENLTSFPSELLVLYG